MRILPKSPAQQVRRLTALVPTWAQQPDALGLSPARVAQIEGLLAQASAAQRRAYQARDAARSATLAFELATAALVRQAATAIRTIKITAKTSGTPVEILSRAHLPAPKPRGHIAPPGTPKNFTFTLGQTGLLLLKWECANPKESAGTTYAVSRRIGDHGDFEHLASRGKKHFTDTTIPAGTSSITYEVTAFRSTSRGMPGRYAVLFGNAEASE